MGDALHPKELAEKLRALAETYRNSWRWERNHGKGDPDCTTIGGALAYGRAQALELAADHIAALVPVDPATTSPLIPTNCTHVLRRGGAPYPRTCAHCGLGPCPFYNNDGSVKS